MFRRRDVPAKLARNLRRDREAVAVMTGLFEIDPSCHRPRKRTIQYSRAVAIESRSRVLDTPWVHDTSATPARVLWRWDNVMASSALKSALRSTACMQAVDLNTKLLLR